MDFDERNLIERAKQMDKNLDRIVKSSYEVKKEVQPVVEHHIPNRRPLFFALGGLAACLAIGILSFSITSSLLKKNDINPITSKTTRTSVNHSDTSNGHGSYTSNVNKPPFGDVNNYNSENFGFGEYAYFVPFLGLKDTGKQYNLTTGPLKKAVDSDNNGGAFFDEQNRLHYPIEIRETYKFKEFFYFEFDNTGSDFLEERIGRGRIQGMSVLVEDIYNEYMLVLKNENRFYSCLINGASFYMGEMVESLRFSAHKTIEGWDLVKDSTMKIPLNITFRQGAGYLGAETIEINHQLFNIDPTSTYLVNAEFELGVNDVRSFLALEPDDRFGKDYVPITIKDPKEVSLTASQFTLEEFGNMPFEKQVALGNNIVTYTHNGDAYILDELFTDDDRNSIFLADVNYDGYRDLVYLAKRDNDTQYVVAYDLHNNTKLKEIVKKRPFDIWFVIENHELKACAYTSDELTGRLIVYDYASIVSLTNSTDTIRLSWEALYQDEQFFVLSFSDTLGGHNIYYGSQGPYNLVKDQTYFITFFIKFSHNCNFIPDLDPVEAVFSSNLISNNVESELPLTLVSKNEQVHQYVYSFTITEEGQYSFEFMFNDLLLNMKQVRVTP